MRFELETMGSPLDYDCPRCNQRAGQPCVYVAPRSYGNDLSHQDSVQRRYGARLGQPKEQPCNPRSRLWHQAERKRENRERRARAARAPRPTIRAQVALAEREYDHRETTELALWIRAHADVLIGMT